MEQENQQPIQEQERTEPKPPTKTNWKYIAIVVVLGLVVSGGVVWYANLPTPTSNVIVSNETPVNNYNYEESRPMYKCIKDNDCMLVKDGYCGTAISINRAYQTEWTEQDKINTEQARKNRQTCKVATPESLDIGNYTPRCDNSACSVKARQPTQADETANWQTYRNSEFGFEVRYPPDFIRITHGLLRHIIEEENEEFWVEVTFRASLYESDSFRLSKDEAKKQALQFIEEAEGSLMNGSLVKLKNIDLDGRVVPQYLVERDGAIATIYAGERYWFEAILVAKRRGDTEEYRKVYDQILSTFRFAPTPE